MKILITGATGAMAYYLADFIKNNVETSRENHKVYGIGRKLIQKLDNFDRYDALDIYWQPTTRVTEYINEIKPDVVFHLAAMANVRQSFNEPRRFVANNVDGTLNLFDGIAKSKYRPRIVHCCHDEQTELVTRRGIVKFTDIREDDEVVSFNSQTENVEFRPIKKIIVGDYSGDMVRVRGRWIDQLVTPNHSLLYKTQPRAPWKFKQVQEIARGKNMICFPNGKLDGGATESLVRVGSRLLNTNDVFYLLGLYIGDGSSDTRIKKNKNRSGLNRQEYLRVARASGTGRFRAFPVSEGDQEFSYSKSHRVFLFIPPADKARVPALECLRRLNLDPKEYHNAIYFTSKDFVEFFHQVGHEAKSKTIPSWVFSYSVEHLKRLYDGLIDSDGYRTEFSERLTTVSTALVDSFSMLCLLLGKTSTTIRIKPKNPVIGGRVLNGSHTYYVTGSSLRRNISGKNLQNEPYSGKVWCLEVDGLHNFAVRRNGRITFSGNSTSEVYGGVPVSLNPIREHEPFAPLNFYAASKTMQELLCGTYAKVHGIEFIITRVFGYINPRREDLVATSLARQLVEYERGKIDKILHGNLDPIRSFCDARDIAEAYWLAATRCDPGIYNIGSSDPCSISMLALLLKTAAGLDNVPMVKDETLMRPTDIFACWPDVSRFRNATGWKPQRRLSESLLWLMECVRA